jgi:hypothetical protein
LVDFAHPSANIIYLDARHVNVGSGPTFTWYGTESISRPTFRWGIGASTAHYDYTASRSTFPFSSMTYYAGRRGAFDYAWVSGADYDGSATRYASMTLTNWGGSATNYVLDMRDINIQQTYPMNRWASNYVGSIVFGGSIATAPVVITSSRSAVDTDSTVYLNAGSLTYTLPNASARPGRIIGVKLIASGTGTVDTTASQTIDGAESYALSAQYQYVVVQAVSGAWYIISRGP